MTHQRHERASLLDRRKLARTGIAATAGLATGLPALRGMMAQDDATPVDNVDTVSTPEVVESTPVQEQAGPPIPEGTTLVAQGFSNPRFIAVGSDGTLYVTEVGVGGDEPFGADPGSGEGEVSTPGATPVVATPVAVDFTQTRGYTGVVSRVTTDGTREVLVEGLASYGGGVGLAGITLGPGEVFFAIGGVAVGVGAPPLPEENTIWRYAVDTGELTQVASLGQYEVDANPDGTDVNPNLYEIANVGDGTLLVADAGGNTVYSVDVATGNATLVGIVPDFATLTGGTLDPQLGSGQFVPTGLDIGPDGTIYVAALAEFWPEGSPTVGTMAADGTFTPLQLSETLNWVVALDFGPDGNLYASEMASEFTEQGPGPGRVVRINVADGTVEPVLQNVPAPHGMTFDDAGNMFLVIYSAFASAPGAPAGMVVRMDGVAAPV
jgi:hypothetical protein